MRKLGLLPAIVAAQVASICLMYSLRVPDLAQSRFIESDFVVFALPSLIAVVLLASVIRRTSSIVIAILGSIALAVVGYATSMLVALNLWGS